MDSRWIFLIALLWVAAIGTATARAAAKQHGSTLNQLSNEVAILVPIRAALGLVFYGAAAMWLARPSALAWMYLPTSEAAYRFGLVLLVASLMLLTWAYRSLGTNYAGGIALYADHELVTRGPYRWIRHPIYLALIAAMVGMLFVSRNWVMGASGVLLVSLIPAIRVRREEALLAERFGDRWSSYRDRTGIFLIRLRPSRSRSQPGSRHS